jgi:hypothetical protein
VTESDAPVARTGSTLFDLRTVIAMLFGTYGVLLTVIGFFSTGDELVKSGGLNLNLWTGVGMLVFTGLLVLWLRLRPGG